MFEHDDLARADGVETNARPLADPHFAAFA
jgi:hypothetical protein